MPTTETPTDGPVRGVGAEADVRSIDPRILAAVDALIGAARPIIRRPTLDSEESALYDAVVDLQRLLRRQA